MWGATLSDSCSSFSVLHFNPRSPCGERHATVTVCHSKTDFNPRSPCGERLDKSLGGMLTTIFQSTLPVWGATAWGWAACPATRCISIHAPRVGSDKLPLASLLSEAEFQSTLPVWGATTSVYHPCPSHSLFQSTLPVWGATLTHCPSMP